MRLLVDAVPVLRRALGAVALFSGLASLLALVPALFSIQVYDRVLASRSGDTLALLLAVTLFALGIWVALDAARQRLLQHLAAELDLRLSPLVLRHAATASAGSSGPARDLQLLRQALGGPPLVALFDAPWLPLVLAALALLHPVLGAVAVVGVLLVLALIATQDALQRRAVAEATALAIDQAQALEALPRQAEGWRVHNALPALLQRAQRLRDRWMQRTTALQAGTAGFAALLRGLKQVLQALLLAAGAWLVIGGDLTPGVMIGATMLFGRLLGPLEALQHGWRPLREAWPAAQRLAALLQQQQALAGGQAWSAPAATGGGGAPAVPRLRVSDASLGWPGAAKPLLKGLNLEIAPGERIAVIGPAAAGKTTLGRLLLGLVDPGLGQVLVDGRGWRQREAQGDAPRRGWWHADPAPAEGTIAELIACGSTADTRALGDAATAAGVAAWIERLPAGFDTRLARGAFEPSAHQWRGLSLARLLYTQPQLVVIDEPGAVTDGDSARVLRQAIETLGAAGATVLILTGRQSWARLAPRWLVLRDGQLLADGPATDVARQLGMPTEAPT